MRGTVRTAAVNPEARGGIPRSTGTGAAPAGQGGTRAPVGYAQPASSPVQTGCTAGRRERGPRRGILALIAALVVLPGGGRSAQAGQVPPDLGWVRIPAGSFEMGCVESDPDCLDMERPRHPVRFPLPFEMMATEVTVEHYFRFVRDTGYRAPGAPNFEQTGRHPMVLVSWDDAAAFCTWAGARLPTEAEWEYAARAGRSGSIYAWGDAISRDRMNYGAEQCCAGATGGADVWLNTAPVGSFPPNEFGLFDMAGNVWEWVDGWLDDDDYAMSPLVDPPGAAAGYARIARGGSWLNFPSALRTSVRLPFAQTGQTSNVGFRCARRSGAAAAE